MVECEGRASGSSVAGESGLGVSVSEIPLEAVASFERGAARWGGQTPSWW